jgi:hypothetical protein
MRPRSAYAPPGARLQDFTKRVIRRLAGQRKAPFRRQDIKHPARPWRLRRTRNRTIPGIAVDGRSWDRTSDLPRVKRAWGFAVDRHWHCERPFRGPNADWRQVGLATLRQRCFPRLSTGLRQEVPQPASRPTRRTPSVRGGPTISRPSASSRTANRSHRYRRVSSWRAYAFAASGSTVRT